jgi:hypothetical protein
MKKTLLLVSLAIGLYSCKKVTDDVGTNKSTTSSSLLTGKWTYKQDSVNFYSQGKVTSQVERYDGTEFMQFNVDGSGKTGINTFTYILADKTLKINFGAYTLNGATYPAETQTVTILQLSSNKLYMFYDFTSKDANNSLTGNSVYATLTK